MNIEEIDKKLNAVKDNSTKICDLITDLKVCTTSTTKTLVESAIRKYLSIVAGDVKSAIDASTKEQNDEQ